MHRARRRPGMGMLMMAMHVSRIGLEHIPPATFFFAGLNVALFYFDVGLHETAVCIGAPNVWYNGEVRRLLWASLYHWNEMHLAYNIGSFLWKGKYIEGPIMSTKRFAWCIVIFALLSNIFSVLVAVAAHTLFGYSKFMNECAVGFSAVLFALKVVLSHDALGYTRIGFLPWNIPMKWAAWGELLWIQLIFPHSSFIGHLCGILAGLVYTSGYANQLFDVIELVIADDMLPRAPEFQQPHDDEPRYYQRRDAHIRNGVLYRG